MAKRKKPLPATPVSVEEFELDAYAMRYMREIAIDLGYSDVLEALEDLERLKARPKVALLKSTVIYHSPYGSNYYIKVDRDEPF